jgi:hypothetical protein
LTRQRSQGRRKLFSQWVPVYDAALLARLQNELQEGDEIEVVIRYDRSPGGCGATLKAVSRAAVTA